MKKLFFIFLLALCGSVSAAFFWKAPHPVEECAQMFASGTYTAYRQQLVTFCVQHPCYSNVPPFKAFSEDPDRFNHQDFLNELRELIDQSKTAESEAFLKDLLIWVYTGVDLNQEMQTFLFSHCPEPDQNLLAYLSQMQKKLRQEGKFEGTHFESPLKDYLLQGNLPSRYFFLPQGIPVIRMGQPLIDTRRYPWKELKPSPEFEAFLNVQPTHLYVNLMKRKGTESPETRALEQLENVYVVTLDKDSAFYWQRKEAFPDIINSAEFKAIFLKMLEGSNFYWSSYLKNHKWKSTLQQILEDVHERYFPHQTELNADERRDFIELSYLLILDKLVETLRPASVNITCKFGMDRGPSLLVLWMMHHKQGSVQEIAAKLLTPPLLIHNRASHTSRIERFIAAATRMNHHE